MNREKAEKILSALIFDDLDDASKADLLNYLETDDELRERLADLRMAVKVVSDTLQHEPDPVLSEHRIKRLAKLAARRNARLNIFTVRQLTAVAAIFVVALLSVVIVFNGRTKSKMILSSGSAPTLYEIEFTGGTTASSIDEDRDGRYTYDPINPVDYYSLQDGDTDRLSVRDGDVKGTDVGAEQTALSQRRISGRENWGKAFEVGGSATVDLSNESASQVNNTEFNLKFRGDTVSYGGGMMGGMGGYRESMGNAGGMGGMGGMGMGGGGYISSDKNPVLSYNDFNAGTGHDVSIRSNGQESQLFLNGSVATVHHGGDFYHNLPTATVKAERSFEDSSPELALSSPPVEEPISTSSGIEPAVKSIGRRWERLGIDTKRDVSFETVSRPSTPAQKDLDLGSLDIDWKAESKAFDESSLATYHDRIGQYGLQSSTSNRNGILLDEMSERVTRDSVISNQRYDREFNKIKSASEETVKTVHEGDPIVVGETEHFEIRDREPILGDVPVLGDLFGSQEEIRKSLEDQRKQKSEGLDRLEKLPEGKPSSSEMEILRDSDSPRNLPSKPDSTVRGVEEDFSDLPESSRFKQIPVNPWVMTARDSQSTFALDVDTASYTLCRRYLRGGFLPPPGAVRMEEFINYFNYNYPQRSNPTFAVHAQAAPSPFATKGQNLTLLKIGVKARTVGRDQRRAAHLVFVVDASASMGQPDRLLLVQKALGLLVDKLSAYDRISLITCAGDARLHLESSFVKEREKIRSLIDAIQPAGSTNLLAGLKLGYATARRTFDPKQINHVILCSDGVANVGQTEAQAILNEVAADRKQGITITCVGVGYGSYNDAFLEALANRGDGSYVFLDSTEQAQRVFVEQLAATLQTVARDARIQVEFNPRRVRRYRLIGYENRDIEDKRFRDDTIDAGEVGSGQCSTALYELELTGSSSADRQDDLGTVFVRYRNAENGQIEEISSHLNSMIVDRLTVESAPRFFLAAGVARFAEILRGSEHARQTTVSDVLRIIEPVSLALPLDHDVRELVDLIRMSENLPKSP
ncbi:MAG: von Willebrand factor type A domain-containing protein [Sedimentisphaerales bacterium]|nr:von Willebrand factor type A domain-containing protein [Sedimentisphaerales bacterium]